MKLPEIALFVMDVDGTLTNGCMYYTADGEFMKRFHTRDGHGIQLLREQGIPAAIITSEESEIALRRAEKLRVNDVSIGVKDKVACLQDVCDRMKVSFENVAYVGDDVNDLAVMKAVGVSFAVGDAHDTVRSAADIVLTARGGEGAVREAVDLILASMDPAGTGGDIHA